MREYLLLLCEGYTPWQMIQELGYRDKTIRNKTNRAFKKGYVDYGVGWAFAWIRPEGVMHLMDDLDTLIIQNAQEEEHR